MRTSARRESGAQHIRDEQERAWHGLRYANWANVQGSFSMCDYSLHVVSSRPAEAAETIVTSEFAGTKTRGFASPADPATAVCLRPGTEIVFDEDARTDGFLFRRSVGERLARFRQVGLDEPARHHDALEFANGTIVLVTDLAVGQRATVLQLPADPAEKPPARTAVPAAEILSA
jgi:hypothetical protein